ncbi:hypothetical protein QWY82_11335 [Simiduia curdlanivorans]|uniref:Uncharacterized protein n=1 Tax=Simiduia curdlanivorans TaxID=1492769 RepID=A0ABV8V9T8_9GAMM|nr:hypothetical protein [Simiduia curdlanivorans]MDN3639398.1 hypothetical protein [Simiduia curdlanivorans]
MSKILEQLGIIYPNSISTHAVKVTDLFYEIFPNEKIELSKTRSHFIFRAEPLSKFSNSIKIEQEEFPTTSLDWVIENLELAEKNIPLKHPRKPGDVTVCADFSEETIGLSPS